MNTIWPPDLTKNSDPKYIVLIQSMRAAIRSGELPQGQRMPPVRELAWDLKITPGTVARVYKLAAEEGLVTTEVGRGTFVSGGPVAGSLPEDPLLRSVRRGMLDFRAVRVPEIGQEAVIRSGLQRLAQSPAMAYTDYPTSETDRAARAAVAQWIGPDRAGPLEAEDIILGMGAQNTVIMLLQALLHGPNPVILTEELGYPGVRHAARLLRAQLVGVEMDAEGIRPDAFEEALRREGAQVLLTVGDVHSPTTRRPSVARRQEIAALARKYQIQIIEDDCHCISRPTEPGYRAICPERAWFVSSLTKTVSASLRFGYAACARDQAALARQVAQSSFYGMPQPILDLSAQLIESGEAERLRAEAERSARERVKRAVNVLGRWDISWREDVPFLWLRLPQGWRASRYARACAEAGIDIKPADEFSLPDGRAPNAVRIGLNAQESVAVYEAALRKMDALLARPPANVDL